MGFIHFIGGEKGGVGKSLVAPVLAQHFIDQGLPFVGFDADKSHGALLRFYTDYAAPVRLDKHDSLDPIIDYALDNPQRRILPDATMQKIDQKSASFWAAVNHSDNGGAGLGLLERQRVKVWLNRTAGELAKVAL